MFINDELLQKVHKRASTLAFTLMSLPIIFAIAVELFPPGSSGSHAPSFYPFLEVLLIFATCVQIVLIVVLRNRMIAGGDQEEEKEDEDFFVQRLFKSFIVSYAFCCSIAIYGLLLFVFGKDTSLFYGFLFSALMLMILQFPKYKDWEEYIKNIMLDPVAELKKL